MSEIAEETAARTSAARKSAARKGTVRSGHRLRLWMYVNAAALGVLCYQVSAVSDARIDAAGESMAHVVADPVAALGTLGLPTRQQLLNTAGGLYFGVETYRSPTSLQDVQALQLQAGARPTMAEYSVTWPDTFDAAAVADAYRNATVPVLTWELPNAPDDDYLNGFARAVAAMRAPVVLRPAPSLSNAAQYAKEWRHIHDLFRRAGAGNVIWVWSPDSVPLTANAPLTRPYPGDAYVDWIGLDGYGVQADPAATFGPVLTRVRGLTRKPILITGTGASTPAKAAWIKNFFGWLAANPEVIGFIWYAQPPESSATPDWRFTTDTRSMLAFRAGMSSFKVQLARTTAEVTPRHAMGRRK